MKKICFSPRHILKYILPAATLLGVCLSGHCAAGYEDASRLKSLIERYVTENVPHEEGDEISVVVSQLDKLRLASCHNAVNVSFSQPGQTGAVILKCEGTENWNVFVPVQIQIITRVLSVNHLIAPGESITEKDVDLVPYDKNRLYDGYFRDKSDVVGLSAARSITAGTPLSRKNLKQVVVIKKNQTITLALERGAIDIEMIGVAKTDGFMNGPIKVFNPSSKKIVDAVVTGKNRAEITY